MTPSKRGLTVLSILIFLVPFVFATHSATITSNYATIYETNPTNITLTVDNGLFSAASINNVNVQTNGFSINNMVNILGWTTTNNNSINFFTNTNAISNWGIQRFGFSASANNVNQDTTYNWDVITTDTNGDSQTNTLQLQVLNDNTPPAITGTTPGNFILGTSTELFSVNANDPETGIASSNLYLSNCDPVFDPLTNTSNVVYSTLPLSCSNNVCSINQDLSSENEGDICFYYDVSNNGGETAVTNNLTIIIDRTAPSVSLISPANNAFINDTSVDFIFNAVDNYDTNLDCNLDVNGNPNAITGSGNLTYNLAVTDGIYTWSVSCNDEVSLTGTSISNSFTVDNSAPNITINVPSINDRGNDVIITTSITDVGSGVDPNSIVAEILDTNNNPTAVTITNNQIVYPTTVSTVPGTYTVTITASDNLGHATTEQVQFRIRETYTITLNLPSNADASAPNNTVFVNLTGNIVRDDGFIPNSTIDLLEIVTNETLTIDAQGNFATQIEIPQSNGVYSVIASFINGIDAFVKTANIAVGPYCGNGVIDNNEQCDGNNLNGQSCSTFGYSQGSVSCTASCTIVTTQCSNPPPPQNTGGSSGGSHSSYSGPIIQTQQIITPPEPPVIEEVVHSSGIIEPVQEPIITNTTSQESSLGIGASWAAFVNYTKSVNKSLLLVLAVIAALSYIFGFRKKEDEWDRYFKRYGHK